MGGGGLGPSSKWTCCGTKCIFEIYLLIYFNDSHCNKLPSISDFLTPLINLWFWADAQPFHCPPFFKSHFLPGWTTCTSSATGFSHPEHRCSEKGLFDIGATSLHYEAVIRAKVANFGKLLLPWIWPKVPKSCIVASIFFLEQDASISLSKTSPNPRFAEGSTQKSH